jgi:hypothetical protein
MTARVEPRGDPCQPAAATNRQRSPNFSPTGGTTKAVDDWAAEALNGLADKTVRSHVDLLRPVTMPIGQVALRDLTAEDVRRTLSKPTAFPC